MTVEVLAPPQAVSPLHGWAPRFAALPGAVDLQEVPCLQQRSVRLFDAAAAGPRIAAALGTELPMLACTATNAGDVRALWLGPNEWLVTAPADRADVMDRLEEAVGAEGSVVDVSAQRTVLRLRGARARDLLAHGCAVDLHPSVAPSGTCVQTSLAKALVAVVAWDADGEDYWVVVRSSFATYLAEWLVDACAPHADEPDWQ